MNGTVSKWGNSLAVRLPRQLADQLALAVGTQVTFAIESGALKIVPARPRYKLSDLLAGEPAPDPDRTGSLEIDWGAPRGKETW